MHSQYGPITSLKSLSPVTAAVACFSLFALAGTPARAQINNTISAFPIEADGAYTTPDEWTDVTPAWFISDPATGATPTSAGDPNANSLLFAGLARDTPTSDPELYLMYDYLPRTTPPTAPGEIIGTISFPLTLTESNGLTVTNVISVEFVGSASLGAGGTPFFDVKVNTQDGQGFVAHPELGLEAGVGFGVTPAAIVGAGSPFHTTTHELIELGVPLNIPAGFGAPGGPFPTNGQSGNGGNGYSPDPAFWQSTVVNDSGDPPASAGLFTIHPDGSTLIIPHSASPIPGQIDNPISNFPIEADGAYTTAGEWTDITPSWFVSDPVNGATPTFPGDISANSLLFAGLSRDTPASNPELYLMYDYLARTTLPTQPGEFLGSVSFPLTLVSSNSTVTRTITVEFLASSTVGAQGSNLFDVEVDTQDGQGFVAHPELGLEAGLGFGVTPDTIVGATSPFHTTTHELIELGVPLSIPAGFGAPGGPFPTNGQSSGGGGGYSPDPAYWGAVVTDNSGDPPASGGLFTIHPDGSTGIVPHLVPAVPASPVLTVAHAAGNKVTLSWSEAAIGFKLQSSTTLGSSANWQAVSPAPAISSLQNVVTNSIAVPSQRFYRLVSVPSH